MENNTSFWVYILYSSSIDKSYVGHTQHLQKRIHQHNRLSNKGWTKRGIPWILIYKTPFKTRVEATDKEKYFKSATGRPELNSIIANFKLND